MEEKDGKEESLKNKMIRMKVTEHVASSEKAHDLRKVITMRCLASDGVSSLLETCQFQNLFYLSSSLNVFFPIHFFLFQS